MLGHIAACAGEVDELEVGSFVRFGEGEECEEDGGIVPEVFGNFGGESFGVMNGGGLVIVVYIEVGEFLFELVDDGFWFWEWQDY